MDLSELPLFRMINKRMGWLTQRQRTLAHNIANSDTPGYRPYDLKAQNFSRLLTPSVPRQAMRTTSSAHMEALSRPARYRAEKSRESYEATPSGNAVVIEEQLMKVNETQMGYRLATNLYQKHISMIKMAIGRQR